MGKQEHTFGHSLTTLTTVVRVAVSHSIGAPIGPPVLHRINMGYAETQALSSFLYPDPLSTPPGQLFSTLSPSTVAHPPPSLPYSLQVSTS